MKKLVNEFAKLLRWSVVLIFATTASASDKSARVGDSQTLAGLEGVHVAIGLQSEDVRVAGLSKERLQTALELRLRTAGIRLLTQEEMSARPEVPLLALNVHVIEASPPGAVAYTVDLEMCVQVKPKHGKLDEIRQAVIWRTDLLGYKVETAADRITSYVREMADSFANDFLKANPKER